MERNNTSISAQYEAKILDKLVTILPVWVTPDLLTLLAFLTGLFGFFCYVLAYQFPILLLVINGLLIVHWFADSLDGKLARYRKRERPNYGYYIDHVLDTASAALFLGGLESSALTTSAAWGWVLICMLLSMVHVFLITKVTGVFQFSLSKYGPTEARLLLITLNTFIFFYGNPSFLFVNLHKILPAPLDNQILLNGGKLVTPVTLFDIFGWVVVIVFMALICIQIGKTAWFLDKKDKGQWVN